LTHDGTAPTAKLAKATIYEIASQAFVDWRSVQRFFDGKPMRGLTATRIRDVCEMLGIAVPAQGGEV
jgi:hypothetical protein